MKDVFISRGLERSRKITRYSVYLTDIFVVWKIYSDLTRLFILIYLYYMVKFLRTISYYSLVLCDLW